MVPYGFCAGTNVPDVNPNDKGGQCTASWNAFQCGQLIPGRELRGEQSVSSCDGRFQLKFQNDGNLVLYTHTGLPIWASGTHHQGGDRVVMQTDGNLVMYTPTGGVPWATHTYSAADQGASLFVQDDGEFVIRRTDGQTAWRSNSKCYNAATTQPIIQFAGAGPVPGLHCISINEPSDPDTWADNYLCSNECGISWSHAGPIGGMRCTQITEARRAPEPRLGRQLHLRPLPRAASTSCGRALAPSTARRASDGMRLRTPTRGATTTSATDRWSRRRAAPGRLSALVGPRYR